ncbi:MAG: hypothetical protein R3C01_10970 [Planctomycetaceae bacterium]
MPQILKTAREADALLDRAADEAWTELAIAGPEYLFFDYTGIPANRSFYARKLPDLTHRQKWPPLKRLVLVGFGLDAAGAIAIAEHLRQLTSLDLSENSIGEAGAVAIAEHLHQLTSLNLGGNSINEAGAVAIAQHLHQLTSLDLGSNSVGDEGAVAIVQNLHQLTSLDLGSNSISDAGAVAIARHLYKLTSLSLDGNSIRDAGAVAIAQHLHQLTSLNLRFNSIDDVAAATIAQHLHQLTSLLLAWNSIGDAGAVAIAQAIRDGRLPNLETLDLRSNRLAVDEAVLGTRSPERIAEAILSGQALDDVRVMFVGMGNVGKSWLYRRCFQQELVDPLEERRMTESIELIRPEQSKWRPQIEREGKPLRLTPRVWDFAGQLVTHGVHETFLRGEGQTVCILVASAHRVPGTMRDHEQEETGNHLAYWLKAINYFAGETVPTVIAVTQCDHPSDPRPIDQSITTQVNGQPVTWSLTTSEPDWLTETFKTWVTNIIDNCSACDKSLPIEPLQEAINSAIGSLTGIGKKVTPKLPALRDRVERELQYHPFVDIETFREWCKAESIIEEQEQDDYLEMLDLMGSLFFFGRTSRQQRRWDDARERERILEELPPGRRRIAAQVPGDLLCKYVHNPHWLKQAAYEIIRETDRERVMTETEMSDFVAKAGKNLSGAAANRTPQTDEVKVVREFLKWTELCFEEQGEYHFPRGYPLQEETRSDNWTTRRIFTWDFIPEAIFHRLLVRKRLSKQIVRHGNTPLQWRYAAIIEEQQTRAAILCSPEEGTIELRWDPRSSPTDWDYLCRTTRDLFTSDLIGKKPLSDHQQGEIAPQNHGAAANAVALPPKRKPGRPRKSPEEIKRDARIYRAWKASGETRHMAFFEKEGHNYEIKDLEELQQILNRHPKRKK